MGEIIYLFYSYNATTYIDQQTVLPSFWFRWWRPGFLLVGILYDIGLLAYTIYMDDISAVLLAVRLTMGIYQLRDQLWLIKHWVPFFVQKQKQRFLFVRIYLISSVWFFIVGCTSWSGSWQERNDIFANVYYMSIFAICLGNGLWFLIQGGVDFLVKYRFHCARNLFGLVAFSGMILGTVGLSIGDGGGNNLVETLKYHSAFVMIYFSAECMIAVIFHRFMVVFEELSWKYPNPIISRPSTPACNETTALEATNGLAPASNRVACDVDVPSSSIELVRTGNITIPTIDVVAPPANHNNVAVGDNQPSHDVGKLVEEEDGKDEEDLEAAAHRLVSQSVIVPRGDAPSVVSPTVTPPPTTRRNGSIIVSDQTHRRLALAFDGIIRRSSVLRNDILTHHIMMVKLRRHELVCREVDKLFSVLYQMVMWEVVIWLAQTFLALYLRSVNTPTLPGPGHDGYYCQTPIENNINAAQFANDFVFARR